MTRKKREPKPFEYEMPSDEFLRRAKLAADGDGLTQMQAYVLIEAVKHANKVFEKQRKDGVSND